MTPFPFYDEQRDLFIRFIPFERDASLRILDLGCGPGLLAARILAEFPRAELKAFDLTAKMIDACRSRLAATDRATYQIGDFRTDDFWTGYDLIVASLSLHHLELVERPGFFARAYRGLNPRGHLISAEVIVDESSAVREDQYQLWRAFMAAQGEDGDAWYNKHIVKDHPAEISALVSMLSEAGFETAGCFWRYLNFAIIGAHRAAV